MNDAQWLEFDVDSNDDLTNSDSSGDDSNNEVYCLYYISTFYVYVAGPAG